MYNSTKMHKRIKKQCDLKNISQQELLRKCELNKNALYDMNDTKGISCFSLCRIAEELDCSVDYLLGRTTNTEVNI